MNENRTFAGETGSFEKLTLTESEIKLITELGLTPDDLSKLLEGQHFAEGTYALIFEVPNNDPELVAKVWKNPKHDLDRARNENVAMRLLRISDFNDAPKITGALASSEIIFEEKIDGTPIEQFDNNILEHLATALASLHSIKLNKYGKPLTERKRGTRLDYLHDLTEKLRELASSFQDQADVTGEINQLLDKMENLASEEGAAFLKADFTLIHFDLNKGNILYSEKNDKLAIIDWEQAAAGDNAMDIAKLFFKSNLDSDQKIVFLSQYEKQLQEKDPYLESRLQVYKLFVLANSILWRLSVLHNDAPQEKLLPNEKEFYERVKNNLDKELEVLKSYLF